jgi:transposase-like protein
MDRALLAEYLREGLSLEAVGRRMDRDPSTVRYWLTKYGLEPVNVRKHTARGALKRAELEALVTAGRSIREIAAAVDRSPGAVRHWLSKYGLRAVGRPGAPMRDGALEARAGGLPAATIVCARHGATEHVREPRGYYRCRRCRAERVVLRRQAVKKKLVEEAGGCCQICGYSRCIAALEFHHRDPRVKEFGLARRGAHSIERLRAEARKCVLLCSNCHAEVESGAATLP